MNDDTLITTNRFIKRKGRFEQLMRLIPLNHARAARIKEEGCYIAAYSSTIDILMKSVYEFHADEACVFTLLCIVFYRICGTIISCF